MKRTGAVLLILCLLCSMLPVAHAQGAEHISEEGIAFIANLEGFRSHVYEAGGKYYIGYGTACGQYDYPNGIDEAFARELLLQHMVSIEEKLLNFAAANGLEFAQHQFDALASFSYNLGTGWLSTDCRLRRCLTSGVFDESEFANAMGIWCHVNSLPDTNLANRRIAEIQLFLYGQYISFGLNSYVWAMFDPQGGQMEDSIMYYPIGATVLLPTPQRAGYTFTGWVGSDGLPVGEGIPVSFGANTVFTATWASGGDAEQVDPMLPITPETPEISEIPETPAQPNDPELPWLPGIGELPELWINPYTDVLESDWFYFYLEQLSKQSVVSGYPDGSFRPGASVTGGEALKLILLAAGYEPQSAINEDWASGYLKFARDKGFIDEGMIDDLSKPVSRQVIAVLTQRALGLPQPEIDTPFADTSDSSVLALYMAGIVTGSYDANGVLRYLPGDSIIRSEACAIVWRITDYVQKLSAKPLAPTEPQEPAEPTEPEDPIGGGNDGANTVLPELPYGVKPIEGIATYSYNDDGFYTENGIKKYSFNGSRAMVGIDVSHHQGEIDWQKVAAQGVEYAMIRVGYRGYTDGGVYEDDRWRENLEGAKAAGLKVGVYFFSQAINREEGWEEAYFVLERIAGYEIDFPVAFDWEDIFNTPARTSGVTTGSLCDAADAFCATIEAAGYTPMVYFNTYISLKLYDLARISSYDFWFAGYTEKPGYYYHFDMWQYSDKGKVDGISEKVDLNLCFVDYSRK